MQGCHQTVRIQFCDGTRLDFARGELSSCHQVETSKEPSVYMHLPLLAQSLHRCLWSFRVQNAFYLFLLMQHPQTAPEEPSESESEELMQEATRD